MSHSGHGVRICEFGKEHGRCRCIDGSRKTVHVQCDCPAEHSPTEGKHHMPTLNETDPRLIAVLQRLMDEYGPAGVVLAAQQMQGSAGETVTEDEIPFLQALSSLLNRYSKENQSGTADFILAQHLSATLMVLDRTIRRRDQWWGFDPQVGGTVPAAESGRDESIRAAHAKINALSPEHRAALQGAFDDAEQEAARIMRSDGPSQ